MVAETFKKMPSYPDMVRVQCNPNLCDVVLTEDKKGAEHTPKQPTVTTPNPFPTPYSGLYPQICLPDLLRTLYLLSASLCLYLTLVHDVHIVCGIERVLHILLN